MVLTPHKVLTYISPRPPPCHVCVCTYIYRFLFSLTRFLNMSMLLLFAICVLLSLYSYYNRLVFAPGRNKGYVGSIWTIILRIFLHLNLTCLFTFTGLFIFLSRTLSDIAPMTRDDAPGTGAGCRTREGSLLIYSHLPYRLGTVETCLVQSNFIVDQSCEKKVVLTVYPVSLSGPVKMGTNTRSSNSRCHRSTQAPL